MTERKTEIFVDSADPEQIAHCIELGATGITTNPSIMRKCGVGGYKEGALALIEAFPHLPISLEVLAPDIPAMRLEARELAKWGGNVVVKIPCVTPHGRSTQRLITELASEGIRLNVTAILTRESAQKAIDAFLAAGKKHWRGSYISIFAGRLADIGISPYAAYNPMGLLADKVSRELSGSGGIIWASVRQIFDIYQASRFGVHVITVPPSIIEEYHKHSGKTPGGRELETVRGFLADSRKSGFEILS